MRVHVQESETFALSVDPKRGTRHARHAATARAANARALPFTETVHKICPRCCEHRESRARHAEEEGAEAFFPLRATTKKADRQRAMREQLAQTKLST
jgi:hypothetical protein